MGSLAEIVDHIRRRAATGIPVVHKRLPPSEADVAWSRATAAEYLDHRLTPEGEAEHWLVLAEVAFRGNDLARWRMYKDEAAALLRKMNGTQSG